jgi:6-phosphogluconolactonase
MAIYHMYIGTYTQKGGTGIEHYRFDGEAGGFAFLDAAAAPNPSYLAMAPGGGRLYACLEASLYGENGAIAVFAVKPDGALEEIDRQSSLGAAPCHLTVHPSGKALYAANYVTGSVTQFVLEADGRLGAAAAFSHAGQALGPDSQRQEGPHAHYTALFPDHRALAVVDLGIDAIMIYPLDESGLICGAPGKASAPAGYGPRHMVFSPDGRFAYVGCELSNHVLTYGVKGHELTLLKDQSTLPEDFHGRSNCAAIRLTADGRRLYLTNRFHDSVAFYQVGADGLPTLSEIVPSGGKNPRDCALSPEEHFLLCAHQDSGEVTVLAVDGATGRLILKPTAISVSMPVAVLFTSAL